MAFYKCIRLALVKYIFKGIYQAYMSYISEIVLAEYFMQAFILASKLKLHDVEKVK